MTLYYFLLREWIHLGDSEFMVRSLGVLFSVLTIPAMYALGKRLFDRATGLTAATLLSVHSFHILWSQQARAYSLLLLLLVLTTYLLVCAMESNNGAAYWVAFAIFAALSVYAHLFAVLVLAALALSILFPRPYRVRPGHSSSARFSLNTWSRRWRYLFCCAIRIKLTGLHGLPSSEFSGFLAALDQPGGRDTGGGLSRPLWPGIFVPHAGGKRSGPESCALRLLAFWLVLPPLLTLAVSPIKPLFDPGFMVMCVPAMVMLAARGLIKLGDVPAVRYWAAAAAFSALSLRCRCFLIPGRQCTESHSAPTGVRPSTTF